MLMTVAIVLPCFNAADTLEVQLAALSRQRFTVDCELLFVDNGSTDGSLELVELYRPAMPPLRIIQDYDPAVGRLGVANSYAVAIRASTADAFLFCEADDEVADNWFETMCAALEEHQFVAAAMEYSALNPYEFAADDGGQQSKGLSTFPGRRSFSYASGCSMGFRREVVDAIGTPDVTAGPVWDVEFCSAADLAGIELAFVPGTSIHYRLRHDGRARFRQGRSWGAGYVTLMRRYADLSTARVAAMFVKRLGSSLWRFRRVVLRQRSLRRWLWDFGWAWGIGDGLVGAVRDRRHTVVRREPSAPPVPH